MKKRAPISLTLLIFIVFATLGVVQAMPQSSVSTGLVGYWTFDDLSGQVVLDSSGNGNDVSLGTTLGPDAADPDWTLGVIGGALDFDGLNDFASAGDEPAFNLPLYSWSLWVNGDNAPGTAKTSQPLSNADGQFVFSWDHRKAQYLTSASHQNISSFPKAQVGDTLDSGTWYHIAGTYDGASIRIYLDGVLQETVAGGPPNTVAGDLLFGAGIGPGLFFDGRIDEVRIYDRALSDAEVQEIYAYDGTGNNAAPGLNSISDQELDADTTLDVSITANDPDGDDITLLVPDLPDFGTLTDNGDGTGTLSFAPDNGDIGVYSITVFARDDGGLADAEEFSLSVFGTPDITSGLVGYWPLDDLSGQVASDLSGNGNDGTLGSSSSSDSGDPQWIAGHIGGALDFDGANDLVSMGDHLEFELPNYSYSFWVNGDHAPANAATTQAISNADGQFVFSWDHIKSNYVASGTHQSGSNFQSAQLSTSMQAGNWYHITVTYDGVFTSVYLNGSLENSVPSGVPNAVAGVLQVGAGIGPAGFFDGKIDDLRIYDRALSNAEVQEVFLFPGSSSGEAPPVLNSIGDQSVLMDTTLVVQLTATDVNSEDTLAYSVTGLPSFGVLDDNGDGTGSLTFNPDSGELGTYDINVRVTDSTDLFDFEIFTLTVSDGTEPNEPPDLDPISNYQVDENDTVIVPLSATDPNTSETLALSSTNLPSFGILDDDGDGTGSITFNPGSSDTGTYLVSVVVTDFGNLTDTENFTLTVGPLDTTVGLIGYWPFDEFSGQVATDFSGNGNNGNLGFDSTSDSGDPAWVLGKVGGALDFDGTNDWVNMGDQPEFLLQNSYTYALWFNSDTVADTSVSSQMLSNANQQFSLSWGHVQPKYVKSATHDSAINPPPHNYIAAHITSPVASGTWYHIATTFDGSFIRLYINGVLQESVASGPGLDIAGDLQVGAGSLTPQSGPLSFFDGTIDEVRIYDRALNETEIEQIVLYTGASSSGNAPDIVEIPDQQLDENTDLDVDITSTSPVGNDITLLLLQAPGFASLSDNGDGTGSISLEPGFADDGTYEIIIGAKDSANQTTLESFMVTVNDVPNLGDGVVAIYRFDEASGQAVLDDSGNGHDGTLGSATNGDSGEPLRVAGQIGGALDFDGSDDFVLIGDDPDFALPSYSYAFWINGDSAPGGGLISQPVWNADQQFVFSWDHTNASFRASGTHRSGSSYAPAHISTPLQAGIWYHVAVTYDGEFIRIYLDGSLEDTIFSASPNTAPGNLLFGSSFSGKLDEIYIYDRKLGEVEVQALASLP